MLDHWESSVRRCVSATAAVGTVVGRSVAGSRRWVTVGVADRDGGPELGPSTLFAAYSLSKPITALAVLSLCNRLGIDLEEPVNERLQRLVVIPADPLRPVQLGHLLTHTAGVRSDFEHWVDRAPERFSELVGGKVGCDFAAGWKWAYSNGGFGVLTEWIQDVAEQRFADFVHDTVFAPLGMTTSVFLHEAPSSEPAARGYAASGSPASGLVPSVVGAGGLWSSPQDLLAFAEGVAQGDGPLSRAVALAATPRCPTTRADLEQALGFMVRTVGERMFLWHNGAGIGGYTELFAELGAPLGVVLMTNTAIDLGDCVIYALE